MIGNNLERFANSPANLEHVTLYFEFGGQKWDIVNDFPWDIFTFLLHCEHMPVQVNM